MSKDIVYPTVASGKHLSVSGNTPDRHCLADQFATISPARGKGPITAMHWILDMRYSHIAHRHRYPCCNPVVHTTHTHTHTREHLDDSGKALGFSYIALISSYIFIFSSGCSILAYITPSLTWIELVILAHGHTCRPLGDSSKTLDFDQLVYHTDR